jgi:ribosomal protein S18 acetylase RimI-like enzyme
MDILFYHNISEFQRRALPLLKSNCAVNSLNLGILEYYHQSENELKDQVFAVGVKQDAVMAVFIQTRSLYFFTQDAYLSESIHDVIEEFLARQIKIPGVMGHGDTALHFAEAWKQRTQADFQFAGKDYLYELQHIGNTQPVTGALQLAGREDMPELKPLFKAYYQEDLGITKTDQELEQSITGQLAESEIYLWNDEGVKSMVTAMLPFDSGVELANVFTPQEHRRKGYASACITEVCRALLERYARIVLFVDQENIAANALYKRIGFHVVDELNTYTLAER